MLNKIILGTAKIGIKDYGFSSKKNHSNDEKLLLKAEEYGISTLDTSPRYGSAEFAIGKFHDANGVKFKVDTKVDNLLVNDHESEYKIFNSVENSIRRMNVSKINTLYLHQNELEILSDTKILNALEKLKNEGLIEKIGSSIYNYEECQYSIDCDIYDVVQVPVSIMDSFIYSTTVRKNELKNTQLVARSIFLQGILFNRVDVKKKIQQSESVLKYLQKIDDLSAKYNISLIDISCAFVASLPSIINIIVGTKSIENLSSITNASLLNLPIELFNEIDKLSEGYKEWGNPRNW